MDNLNYHHLRYFREVAHEGNLTRTAERVNLSQSALSTQIRQLEARLGHDLFERSGRQLVLTEVGRIVLDHADRIFGTGEELIATLQRSSQSTPPLRVGAQSTLSRNFQIRFLKPLLSSGEVDFTLRSGSASVLLEALESLALDIVLTTDPPDSSLSGDFTAHRLAEQKVTIHGTPERIAGKTLHQLLSDEPLIVPDESSIRTGFDSLVARLGITPRIVADVDDMAMVRLLARADVGIAIAPPVVMADEIAAGLLESAPFDLQIFEAFYAVTVTRSFPHPILRELLTGQMD
ncbi:LysR family transcriptional regulator [Labrenzia sp. R4_1]|uniref:Transcriptional regulator n=1 Tax=Roseibium alexandrii (strain DSM 17067 / NCIMB 14079 / DFL-11) TaxID=244592 RepID=A0A5E8GYC7_ROSAD|nr:MULTISPECIES: LysR family transcriptional regulator [Stappiaceae]EEE45044.1 Transcriptional regulator [Roseibium alexandrii DFL-11]MBO9420730.1 LysR family transcriptional regulator [Labrenzia sp. R4_2]MBO9423817.1 LysR family transcriptional regulator [Labrenzia sp. R4_1]OJJ13211.1 LysR family transcriptional regulator [Alphaproteobacteria bacterium AO1-B]